uniref:NADH dehydrogenase subunit 11 n=1 Tax=Cyanophora biloba TaxID=1489483 RepID=A0A873WRI1_9EUKA|nr:NADH dehydrogenase subunit 11 [Cyanophora biloba]QPB15003.1 NADH dehydrogenase subunit 11 [Cyanophora biloba]
MGALTSKPYAFLARSWELSSTETIDILDSACSSIRADTKGNLIMRILPNLNKVKNQKFVDHGFISDRARFAYDGIKTQRVSTPLVRDKNTFSELNWQNAFEIIKKQIGQFNQGMVGVAGRLADIESSLALKKLINLLGSNNCFNSENIKINNDLKTNYLVDSKMLNESVDFCLLIGLNLRQEIPYLNIKLRRLYYNSNLEIALIGSKNMLSYPTLQIGMSLSILLNILEGKHKLCKKIIKSKNALILVGSSYYQRADFSSLNNFLVWFNYKLNLLKTNNSTIKIKTIINAASHAGLFEIGFNQLDRASLNNSNLIYLLLTDEVSTLNYLKKNNTNQFIIYQGHHVDVGAFYSNIVLPTHTYLEKTATYLNLEGVISQTKRVITPVYSNSHEDWKIIIALSQYLNTTMFTIDLNEIKNKINILKNYRFYAEANQILENNSELPLQQNFKIYRKPIHYSIYKFYTVDSITRASKIMTKCIKLIKEYLNFSN